MQVSGFSEVGGLAAPEEVRDGFVVEVVGGAGVASARVRGESGGELGFR